MITPLKRNAGFTVPELLVMVLVVCILSALLLTNYKAARAKERDTQRVHDINLIDSKLETYYNAKGAYPAKFTANDLFGIDADALKDPSGHSITFNTPVANAEAARATASPQASSASDYTYIAYPTNCTNAANNCTGFVLKTYIEKSTSTTPNPYTKVGLNNN